MSLWPVFVLNVMQEDALMLFELRDVVTWSVLLVDVDAEHGWPADVGVRTTVTFGETGRTGGRWASCPDVTVCTELEGEVGTRRSVRAGLVMDTLNPPWSTYVTGTVRRIELVSVAPVIEGASGSEAPAHRRDWMLSEVSVAPVRFRDWAFGDRALPQDQGILVHLEVFSPQCRCEEIGGLTHGDAYRYIERHLLEVEHDHAAQTARYRCPDSGRLWRSRYEPVRPDPGVPDHPDFPPRFVLQREDVIEEEARIERMLKANPGAIIKHYPDAEN